MKRRFIWLINQKWLQHLAFWVLSIYSIASFFSISNWIQEIDFIYSISFHLCLVPIVYINLKWLVPGALKLGRYILYPILVSLDILIGLGLHELIFEWIIPRFFEGYYIVSFTDRSILIIIFLIYITLTTLLKLSRSWFIVQEIRREKVKLELAALRTQINPHFLFNGLNSIYSLALKNDPKAPQAVLKLSNMLRYVLYDISNTFVELRLEIEMINQYLDIQKLRFLEGAEITFTVVGDPAEKKVAPMLFFPLLENAFKHGDLQEGGFINAQLTVKNTDVEFICINKKSQKEDSEKGLHGGIGLENIQKRLELLYAGKHLFSFSEAGGQFCTEINIQTND